MGCSRVDCPAIMKAITMQAFSMRYFAPSLFDKVKKMRLLESSARKLPKIQCKFKAKLTGL